MAFIRQMNDSEQRSYDADAKDHPWMKTVTMSDDELERRLDGDTYDGYTAKWFAQLWNEHYSWVLLAKIKHYYETGMYAFYGDAYMDGQTDSIVTDILKHYNVDDETYYSVIGGKKPFDFKMRETQ